MGCKWLDFNLKFALITYISSIFHVKIDFLSCIDRFLAVNFDICLNFYQKN